ncbi:hypothetical protein JCM16418_2730 [Paenibacillus pini JCM 16418]|uniref:Potassium channel domain-containing protein n=1 Tax=Paenibacillus pini JCM 16418 TaxID=1236976 RepID=W7Z2K1_9BACL|nr:hypothetical protein JCM16418_2730 [Paenibacillus pini JCM 16418]
MERDNVTWWMWIVNIVGLAALTYVFYNFEKKWTSKAVLLAPITIYVLISVEDLLEWIDLMSIVPGKGGMRALILIFCLISVIFYILYIFNKIAESAINKNVQLMKLVSRISMAALTCILFFMIIYTSIYKLFGETAFEGKNIGSDLLSQLISFLYFSVATFVTVGYGDISAVDNTSRLAVIMEIAFSFITVGYALSMLSMFRKIFKPGPDE